MTEKNYYIDDTVQVGEGTFIGPGCVIKGNTVIGKNCVLDQNCRIEDSIIGDNVKIMSSYILKSEVGDETEVGPFAYMRPGSKVGKNCKVGDFVEVKNAVLGDNTKASHLTYIGDADLGRGINLGCGFDDKFSQVDNGTLQWFDVDLPDQIEVRRKVFSDRDRCTMVAGNALEGSWTKQLPRAEMNIIVMEGVLEYFSREQVKTCLNMLCDSFPHGYLLAELHSKFLEKHGTKHHDAVKHTNASFGWGTDSGLEYLELEPRMRLVSETSYNDEMKKYSLRGKLFAIVAKNMNNRLAVFRW